MDLTVSPDLDAYLCYAVVALLGAVIAVFQISKRLPDYPVWRVPRTWVLFFLYAIVPVALFWFLDRTSAINDTSLFAALLVGAGYAGIIAGTNSTIRSTADLSSIWKPLADFADQVSQQVLKDSATNLSRVAERVIASIVQRPARYQALETLTLRLSANAAALRTQLAALDAPPAAPAPARPPHEILEDKTRLLFPQLLTEPDAYYLMKTKEVIPGHIYWLYVKGFHSVLAPVLTVVFVSGLIYLVWQVAHFDHRKLNADYYIWRLTKANTTAVDQNRARTTLSRLMRKPLIEVHATKALTAVLRRPGLPIERVDLVLQTLLETRAKPNSNHLMPILLVESLRASGVDARMRVNDVLKHLAGPCSIAINKELASWNPNEKDSTTLLENRIKGWAEFWRTSCTP